MQASILDTIKKCSRKSLNATSLCELSKVSDVPIGSSSSFGEVYQACCGTKCTFILKVIPINSPKTAYPVTEAMIQQEVTMQQKFNKVGLAPSIVEAFSCDNNAYIIMEQMNMDVFTLIKQIAQMNLPRHVIATLASFIISKAVYLVDQAHIKGLVHGDPHLQNIMINTDGIALDLLKHITKSHVLDEEEAIEVVQAISKKVQSNKPLTKLEKLYVFLLSLANEDLTFEEDEDQLDSLASDLVMFFGEETHDDLWNFLLQPDIMERLLMSKTMKLIDFGQSDTIANNPELVATDWSKLGGGKYKDELRKILPELNIMLDIFSMVGHHTS
jgi:serine/threonine protein kinase